MRIAKATAMTIIIAIAVVSCVKKQQDASELAIEIRSNFLKAERLTMETGITADYGDRVYEFGVRYKEDETGGEVTIITPEKVAGVTARVTGEEMTLEYDGTKMETGGLTEDGLSPAEALPRLVGQWRRGYIKSGVYELLGEKETIAIETEISEESIQKTWFDMGTRLPLRSEIYSGGVMVLVCEYGDVTING